jgi:hypothetical protein
MDAKSKKNAATASLIIDGLGGTSKVATLCETSPSAVAQWRENGIPRARLMFLKLARPDVFSEFEHTPAQNSAAAPQ